MSLLTYVQALCGVGFQSKVWVVLTGQLSVDDVITLEGPAKDCQGLAAGRPYLPLCGVGGEF